MLQIHRLNLYQIFDFLCEQYENHIIVFKIETKLKMLGPNKSVDEVK